ncbi:MAG TPA: STAS domain-containing protein [Sedimentisphaerales bacterium]|nr:STAS domain-containing protein [Sedimentisphaerales bacterium]
MDEKVVVDIAVEGDIAVVAFGATSISDVKGIAAASDQIQKFVDENHPQRIVFDFDRVKFFSSQVLGLLLEARAKLRQEDGDVVISGLNPQLHRIFKITNLDKIFRFFPEKESAIRTIGTK